MPNTTTNYSFYKPLVGDAIDEDLWGGYLNDNFDSLDTIVKGVSDKTYSTISTKTANYTVLTTDRNALILVDATAGAVTIALPAAATAGNGFVVTIKKIDSSANAVTIDPNSTETLDGATTYSTTTQYDSVEIVSNATAWFTKAASVVPSSYPSVKCTQSTGQAVSGTTLLLFDSEEFDDDGWHSTSVNTGRITVNFDGRVRLYGSAGWVDGSLSQHTLELRMNGTAIKKAGWASAGGANAPSGCIVTEVICTNGDYFELYAIPQNASTTVPAYTTFEAQKTA